MKGFETLSNILQKLDNTENVDSYLKLFILTGIGLILIIFFVLIGTLILEISIFQHEIVTGLFEIILILPQGPIVLNAVFANP